jgi:hypothetical protein
MNDEEFQVRQIDGHELIFRVGAGWRCDCDVWRVRRDCEHALKAAALLTVERAVRARGGSTRRH